MNWLVDQICPERTSSRLVTDKTGQLIGSGIDFSIPIRLARKKPNQTKETKEKKLVNPHKTLDTTL